MRRPGRAVDALVALGSGAAAALAYLATAGPASAAQSAAPHYVLLAEALLRGRLWIDPERVAQLVDVTPPATQLGPGFRGPLALPLVAAVRR